MNAFIAELRHRVLWAFTSEVGAAQAWKIDQGLLTQ